MMTHKFPEPLRTTDPWFGDSRRTLRASLPPCRGSGEQIQRNHGAASPSWGAAIMTLGFGIVSSNSFTLTNLSTKSSLLLESLVISLKKSLHLVFSSKGLNGVTKMILFLRENTPHTIPCILISNQPSFAKVPTVLLSSNSEKPNADPQLPSG